MRGRDFGAKVVNWEDFTHVGVRVGVAACVQHRTNEGKLLMASYCSQLIVVIVILLIALATADKNTQEDQPSSHLELCIHSNSCQKLEVDSMHHTNAWHGIVLLLSKL